MAVSDFLGDLGVDVSGISNGGFFGAVSSLVLILILAGIAGLVFYFILQKKSWNKRIYLFKEINGGTWPAGVEKAKEVTMPRTSLKAFYLKKSGVFLPRPSLETGNNNYWYFIRNDGQFVNMRPENVNTKLRELGLLIDHSDMRMANAFLKKMVEKNYRKRNVLKEWAPVIAVGILIIGLGLSSLLVLSPLSAPVTLIS